ncbi:MAG: outer membrane beta-barrel protein [Sphingobacteriales bacterium]|nr:outer membrane beta-barrel protein [Sphingobacteriales bacterium]
MKKLLIAPALLLLSVISFKANAQTEKGDWMVGGQMAFNTTSGNSSFVLAPSAGYFFAKNFAGGSELTLSFGKLGDAKSSAIGLGPFLRYYFELKEPQFKPFIHTSFSFLSETNKFAGEKTTNTARNFFLGAGGAYFINQNVALEAMMGYNNTKVENENSAGGFLFRVGFQIHLLNGEVKGKK